MLFFVIQFLLEFDLKASRVNYELVLVGDNQDNSLFLAVLIDENVLDLEVDFF